MITHIHSTLGTVPETHASTSPKPNSARDEALDWMKCVLVVLMVIYHSLNYSSYSHVAFAYIAFLPVSFIFMAGFLLTS